MDYEGFLKSKIVTAPESGFQIAEDDLSPALKPHQKAAVLWALRGGRRALFESFGLGKTVQQLEWCRQVVRHEGGRALVVLPLGVKQEFSRDAVELLGMDPPEYVRTMDEANEACGNILMTNYERVRDGDIDPSQFTATSLDEASVLRSFGSKTYQTFLDKFIGQHRHSVAQQIQRANPLRRVFGDYGHWAGPDAVLPAGQHKSEQPDAVSTQGRGILAVGFIMGACTHETVRPWIWR